MMSMNKGARLACLLLLFGGDFGCVTANGGPDVKRGEHVEWRVADKIVLDKIWSAVGVGFCLLTHEDRQFVAYYNADRRMVVGMRKLSDDTFTKTVLSSKSQNPPGRRTSSTVQGWDSHNDIVMAVDAGGYLHLSGNMHASPLTYFRSGKPLDVTSLKQADTMVGRNEKRCTYPHFMKSPDGRLIFHYRDGGSGNGSEIYNIYDVKTRAWTRMLDKALISGGGKANAYQRGPKLGPDGYYHLIWMWRNTPAVETNHDLSYARSRDLVHWETAAGEALSLPITMADKGTIIDPVPVEGGLHNSNHHFCFDSKGRGVVSYFKHDADDNTQAYVARFDDGKWHIHQVSHWQGKHLFRGGGSGPSTFGTSLRVGSVRKHNPGELAVPFSHWKAGSGLRVLNEETLAFKRVDRKKPRHPRNLVRVQSEFPGMRVKIRGDSGTSPDETVRYMLRWETLGANRDRARKKPWPENSELVLYKLIQEEKKE